MLSSRPCEIVGLAKINVKTVDLENVKVAHPLLVWCIVSIAYASVSKRLELLASTTQ